MPHDASKVLLGATRSNMREVNQFDSDPATYKAGLCVSVGSDGLLSLLKSAGMRAGVSLGRGLSNCAKGTSVLRTGEQVPVRAALKRASGVITVSSYANLVSGTPDTLTVGATVFTAQSSAATPGDATFRAATSNSATATSIATQINAHATAGALVYAVANGAAVTLYSKVAGVGSTGTGNDIALAYTDNDTNVGITLSGLSAGKLSGGSNTYSDIPYATKGAKMYINDTTGEADANMSGFSTISDAVILGVYTGIDEDAAEVPVLLVDMVGGL